MDLVINISYGRPGFLVSLINTSYGECNHTGLLALHVRGSKQVLPSHGAVCYLPPCHDAREPITAAHYHIPTQKVISVDNRTNNSKIDLSKSGELKA